MLQVPMMALLLHPLAHAAAAAAEMTPLLFMEQRDLVKPFGKLKLVANEVQRMPGLSAPPGLNYTGGDTVTAAFPLSGGGAEVFVAVGRPGEPFAPRRRADQGGATAAGRRLSHAASSDGQCLCSNTCPQSCDPDAGVKLQRFTTTDWKQWSPPVTVLYLPNGSGDEEEEQEEEDGGRDGKTKQAHSGGRAHQPLDGTVWTIKSMDRSPKGQYLLAASYGSSVHFFMSDAPPVKINSFYPLNSERSLKKSNFKDHDDVNLFYHEESSTWVDMQIMYENLTTVGLDHLIYKRYCDNIPIDTRRVVTVRTSSNGKDWSNDWGCADAKQKSEHCKSFNTSNMVTGDADKGGDDPPDLEFYRIRPFILGKSGRVAAHVLDYVPSPANVVYSTGYGRQPLWYCSHGCCHAPHMYEEWWIGPPSGNPTEMQEWRRPYRDTKAAPHDIWLMEQPVTTSTAHVWVDNGIVWGLPLYRLAGVYSPGNGEFSTQPFAMPTKPLWLNAEASWGSWSETNVGPWQPFARPGGGVGYDGNYVGGADEARAAYIMVALENATTGAVIPGHEAQRCLLTNVTGLALPIVWGGHPIVPPGITPPPLPAPVKVAPGTMVRLRFLFRDATVFAVGAG